MTCNFKRPKGDPFSSSRFKRIFSEAKAQLQTSFQQTKKNAPSKHLAKQAFLQDRRFAKKQGKQFVQNFSGIYAMESLKTYQDKTKLFIRWCLRKEPALKHWKQCKKFVSGYIEEKASSVSACTLHTYAYAVARAFGTTPKQMGLSHIKRSVSHYKRNRQISKSAQPYYENEKYARLRAFIVATGARRCGLGKLRRKDLRHKGNLWYVFLREKGGKNRWAPVLPEYQDIVLHIFANSPGYQQNESEKTTNGYLFPSNAFPSHFPCHYLRATYVKLWYERFVAEKVNTPCKKYKCRGARKDEIYDRHILQKISRFVGHARVDVMAQSYCYQI